MVIGHSADLAIRPFSTAFLSQSALPCAQMVIAGAPNTPVEPAFSHQFTHNETSHVPALGPAPRACTSHNPLHSKVLVCKRDRDDFCWQGLWRGGHLCFQI